VSRAVLVLFLTTCASVGCGQIEHTRQCRSLARLVNGRLAQIELMSRPGTDRKSYGKIAVAYDALGRDLDALRIADPKLSAEIPEVSKVFSRSAGAIRRAARAADHHDVVMFDQASRELERLDQRHRSLVHKLDGLCR
jgi:hypothetical protein